MKINFFQNTEELDLKTSDVVNAVLAGGKELRDLRRLLKAVADFNKPL